MTEKSAKDTKSTDVQEKEPQETEEKEDLESLVKKETEKTQTVPSQDKEEEAVKAPKFWKLVMGPTTAYDSALRDEYQAKLEDLYTESSTEGVRLASKVKELSDQQLEDETGEGEIKDPLSPGERLALQRLQSQDEENFYKAYGEFINRHPEATKADNDRFTHIFQTIRLANPNLGYQKLLEISWQAMDNAAVPTTAKIEQKPVETNSSDDGIVSGTMSSNQPPSDQKETLTEDEKLVASSLNMSEEDYIEGKKLVK